MFIVCNHICMMYKLGRHTSRSANDKTDISFVIKFIRNKLKKEEEEQQQEEVKEAVEEE